MEKKLSAETLQILKESYLPERFVNKIIQDCEAIFAQPIHDLLYIVLFGSCAKGSIGINSDIDLMVITQSPIDRMIKVDLDHELDEEIEGVSTDIVFYDKATYLASECLLVREVKKHGKILWRA